MCIRDSAPADAGRNLYDDATPRPMGVTGLLASGRRANLDFWSIEARRLYGDLRFWGSGRFVRHQWMMLTNRGGRATTRVGAAPCNAATIASSARAAAMASSSLMEGTTDKRALTLPFTCTTIV